MTDATARFASYVATLGRGPGRSRALTRSEATDAMEMLLAGEADPIQIGAFLMLLRYRGEDAEEITGLVQGAANTTKIADAHADLDWPSYGAGRSRGAPWFLLSALALADAGIRVLMHGTNEFTGGLTVPQALAMLGRTPAGSAQDACIRLERDGFAYLPVATLCPPLASLLGLRRLLGLRSPLNTVARLLDPACAAAGVDGVFHPPYIETHLAAAERLGRPRLLVLKGGGGEAERNPAKPVPVHLWIAGTGRSEHVLPATIQAEPPGDEPDLSAIWRGEVAHGPTQARIVATIGMALLALGRPLEAIEVWRTRRKKGVLF